MVNSTLTHKDVTLTHYSTQAISLASRIEVNGRLSQPNRGPAPWPEVHRSYRTGTSVRLRKSLTTSRRMDQAQHGPFSNRSRL